MTFEKLAFWGGAALLGYGLWRTVRAPVPDPAVVDPLARILIVETSAQAPTLVEEHGIMQVVLNRSEAWGSSPDDVIHNRSLNRHGRPRIWNDSAKFLGNLSKAPQHANWNRAVKKARDYLRSGRNPIGKRKNFEHVHDGRPIPVWITNGEYPPVRVGRAMFAGVG